MEFLANDSFAGKESLFAVGSHIEGVSHFFDLGSFVREAYSCGPVNTSGLNFIAHSEQNFAVTACTIEVINQIGVLEFQRVNPVAESLLFS